MPVWTVIQFPFISSLKLICTWGKKVSLCLIVFLSQKEAFCFLGIKEWSLALVFSGSGKIIIITRNLKFK